MCSNEEEDFYQFNYPRKCNKCGGSCDLDKKIKPIYQVRANNYKIMLIGQDPTVADKERPVNSVLTLDEDNGQIRRWIDGIFDGKFEQLTIYATNIVKCRFEELPSRQKGGAYKFLKQFFPNCKAYLIDEIRLYKPDLVITFGETTHKLFCELIEDRSIDLSMKKAFKNSFSQVRVGECKFYYSPCLHIKTYRVAETYGSMVGNFKENIKKFL